MFSTHHQHPPPPIPPSPTLSNPDMILPFDENERENSTPSPPFNLPSLSNLQSFYETRTNNYSNSYSLDPTRSHNNDGGAPRPQQKKGYPRHTWTHEGHDAASRRLSDIGEEDYTSSSSPFRHGGGGPGMRTSQVIMPQQLDNSAPASPVSVREATTAAAVDDPETRTHSSSSNSTISGASETSSWDGTKVRPDYVASHESHGSRSERRAAAAAPPTRPNGGQSSGANAPPTNEEGRGPGEDLSSAILSSEAERILENAKKRLSLMEGNLTRARSSMRASTPSSPSPAPSASAGLGQPVGGLYQSIHRAADRRSSLRPRQTQDNSNRHSRVYSETNIPSTQPSHEPNPSRSVSAMGSSTSSNFYTDDRSFHYAPNRAYLTHRASVSSMQQVSVNGLPSGKERASSDSPRTSEFEEEEVKISSMDDFNSAYPVQDPPSRSQSQLQVRDLQDQMKGLHIKISTLKVKAQEDNLRRRSLQSLRTPSPLTAANHWYANPLDPTERHSHLHPSAGYQHVESLRSSQDSSSNNTDSTLLVPETVHSEGRASSDGAILPPFELTDHEDGHSTAESLYEDAEEGDQTDIDREALEEILREPLDDDLVDSPLEAFPSVPHHDDTPHEEREDAFDYEHFILHSALGNYTQARLRRKSNASDTSVETTRPIRERRSTRHSRSNSANSISTVATFATAAEGQDDIESVLYWDRKFNDELNHRRYADEDTDSNPPRPDSETSLRTPRKSRVEDLASQRPDSAATGSATPTSLASSLVSTVRAAASPFPNAPNGNLGINEDDTRLLEQLFKSLGDVCMELQELTTSPDYDEKQAKLLRRRLEAARRVLDGELD
ncbi:hypothetical protein BJY01DRAFT_238580 [Aspergillus pseudoustus]|uniref:BAG domain-containing protein n=1 Tax=Aspergillus pseudoustus TaxID=1810923 RepID=A0ABR4J6W8_9EURO